MAAALASRALSRLAVAGRFSARRTLCARAGRGEPIPAPDNVAAAPADAEVTGSGLASMLLSPGSGGASPGPKDRVTVDYTGWTTDGEMFDSSVARGEPITFGLDQVIPGWSEGVQLMVAGEKRRLWIPEVLAYRGMPGAPAGTLVFDIELHSFVEAPKPPEAPEDVAAPGADATTEASGLATKVLEAGTGSKTPEPTDMVTVDYSGWTTDGKLFDSSIPRGEPTQFPLNRVIKGWQEGVGLMVEGETRRMWLPANLAYGDSPPPGAPGGQLCFEVKLLKIGD
mmetsp:Transcript_4250/g.14866  ORF Transcript_4250/g.14866 Transcript_4250/m.14866 type:complete len:283 (-) Transcript_4250:216-1064(-)